MSARERGTPAGSARIPARRGGFFDLGAAGARGPRRSGAGARGRGIVRPVRPTRLVLIRHAESTWNASGRWQGQADPPLSERGRRQARALGEALCGEGIEHLFASDLRRAAETAAVVGEALGLVPEHDPRLRELDVGDWAGLQREEIEERHPKTLARFEAGDPDTRPGGGETRREIRRRVRSTAAELVRAHGGCIALVTHLGVIRALRPGAEPANAEFCSVTADELERPEPEDVAEAAPRA